MLRPVALGISAFAAMAVVCATAASAQTPFPTQTVRFVVPAPAGSTTDLLARVVADRLARTWGSATVIENIGGGAMNIGARTVARAAPDGYTLLIAPPSPLSFSHLLYRDPGYDPGKFVPITMLAKIPNVLVVRKGLPVSNVREFIAYAKANPGKVTFASGGVGTTAHLSAAQLEVLAGIKMVHVPYRGSQPAMTDLIGGNVDIFFDTLAAATPLYREGTVKVLGIADSQRAEALPDVPTLSEAGLPGYQSITWFGLVAPPGTPVELAEKINRDTLAVLQTEDVRTFLRGASLIPGAFAPAQTTKFFADEAALWNRVIREAGIEPQ